MQQLTDDDLLISGSADREEKERTVPPDMSFVRQARPDFAYFMQDELRYDLRSINDAFEFDFSIFLSRTELLRRNQMLTACANLDVAGGLITN